MIPKRFIRIWLGLNLMPPIFEKWWLQFQQIHQGYEFLTITENNINQYLDPKLAGIYSNCKTYAGRSDVARVSILNKIGGIYIDTDVMPIRSFNELLIDPRPFAGKRSSKSFESAILGSPANHPATQALVDAFPAWYSTNNKRSASVSTGPAFISSVWFGREDVRHLATKTFYPYNGFMAPKREEKIKIFEQKDFPPEMLAAHFSNHKWGGCSRL